MRIGEFLNRRVIPFVVLKSYSFFINMLFTLLCHCEVVGDFFTAYTNANDKCEDMFVNCKKYVFAYANNTAMGLSLEIEGPFYLKE